MALVLWAEVVLVLAYWKWWPRPLDVGDLHQDERAFTLRLPEDGVLTRMLDRGVVVSVAIPTAPQTPTAQSGVKTAGQAGPTKAPSSGGKKKPAEAAAPVIPAVPSNSVIEHARVLAKVCKAEIQSTTRVAVCYAVIAVPKGQMVALTSAADKVSVWVEGK